METHVSQTEGPHHSALGGHGSEMKAFTEALPLKALKEKLHTHKALFVTLGEPGIVRLGVR